jgi:HlyD family secretion protein
LAAQRQRDALNVEIAKNKLDQLLSGARTQQIKQARANVNIQQISYDQAKKDLTRAKELYKEGSIAEAELERFQNNLIIAQNQLESAQANLSLLLAGGSDEEIKAAQNQVKMMEAVLASSDAVLADLKIICPLEGTIMSMNYEAGEYAAQGACLATVAQLSKIWINILCSHGGFTLY